MMKMNEEKQHTPMQIVPIPAPILTQLFFDVHYLADLHQRLICMYERESALKKHHKAYLHVREEADAVCCQDKARVRDILDHYENPGKHLEEAVLFHESLTQKEAKKPDAFALSEGMVMMSTGTLGVMQDDMLALTVVVDHLVQLFKDIDECGCYDRHTAGKLVREAAGLSQDVFKRWDEADFAELD